MRLSAQGIIYSARAGGGPIAIAYSGNAYVLESAPSPDGSGKPGVFVVNLSPDGRTVVYRTFLGHGTGAGIAVDPFGVVYVTGTAVKGDFPVTIPAGTFTTSATSKAIFVVRLNQSGQPTYSVLVGGGNSAAAGIAIDPSGQAYVAGVATTADFPTTAGAFDRVFHGGTGTTPADTVVFKLTPQGNGLAFSTYLGGSGNDTAVGIVLDLDNNPYVAGTTTSTNFPTGLGSFQPAKSGDQDAFIAKLNTAGTALAYSTYLGGIAQDSARGIAVNEAGEVYIDGVTLSPNFPTTEGAERRSYLGNAFDGFVGKLDQSGSTLLYGTYLGGSDSDDLGGIAVDRSGYAYVTGDTISMSYPVTPGAIQNAWQGSDDAFVTKLNNAGKILYSTYLGSPGPDWGRYIALNLQADVFVSGRGGPEFLLTPQAATTIAAAASGGPFVTRLVPRVSRGRAAIASSVQSTAYPASAVVDANFSTRWSSAWTDAQWLDIDLGEHMDIDRVVLHWERAYGRAYVLQFSDDRQTWDSGTTVGNDEGGIADHTFGGFAGRYLRINLSLRGTSWGYSLWEVDVYGTPASARNISPTAKIVSPADGWSFVGRTTFDIVAEAHDADGTIAKVNFWLNDEVIATDLVPPYVQQITVEDGAGPLRLAVTAEDDRGYTSAKSTITVYAKPTPRGENRALGRPAFASSTESATLSAAKAVDGSGATRWSSAFSDPQWLYVDLGQPYDVKSVVLRWETAYASSFDVQVSSDAQNWRTVHRDSAGTGGTQTIATTDAVGRYVRVYGYTRATRWGYSLYELEVYGTPIAITATNIAKGRPAVASSTQTSSYGAALVTDGKTTTRWSSQFADNQWIYVDLGALYDLTRVVLRWETAFGREYAIEVSNDRSAWRPIRKVTDGDGGVDDLDGLASTARYVRMTGIRRATSYGFSLWEFEVYGTPAALGPNLAPLGRATASTTQNTATTAPKAADGSGSTRWSSQYANNQWIRIDLGAETDIRRVVLRWETAYAKVYSIQLSNDPAAGWQTVLTNTAGNGDIDDLSIDGKARFIQVLCTTRATTWGFSLWEIEVYGPAAPNLLENGGLETADPLVADQPAGWSREMWMATSQLVWDTSTVHGGFKSVRITSPTENDASWTHALTLDANANYILSGWIKTENVAGGIGATLGLMGTWQHTSDTLGTRGWTKVSLPFNSGPNGSVVVAARLGFWGAMSSGTAWFDDISVTPLRPGANPAWKILVLIYDKTDFSYVKNGVQHHVVGTIAPAQLQQAAANARRFVEEDIPALDSGQMIPQVTIRYPGTLTRFTQLCVREDGEYGFWPSPDDTAVDRDPAFDSVIVITQPNVVDQLSGRAEWAGCAAGLTPGMGAGQLYTTMIADAATNYGHLNVFKHEWGHSITAYFDATGTAPKPMVENHAVVRTPTGDTVQGLAVVTNVSTTSELRAGFYAIGAGISPGTLIQSVDSPTQVTLSKPATASGAGVAIEFGQYVHCGTGQKYVWLDESDANPIPNSIYNNQSGFTHDYYSGTAALASNPTACLGITNAAWAAGGPFSKPY